LSWLDLKNCSLTGKLLVKTGEDDVEERVSVRGLHYFKNSPSMNLLPASLHHFHWFSTLQLGRERGGEREHPQPPGGLNHLSLPFYFLPDVKWGLRLDEH
jgi:hypothetical protein